MSLIKPQSISIEDRKKAALERLPQLVSQSARQTLSSLAETQRQGMKLVWNHPVLSPQEVVDALGPDAATAFQVHAKLTGSVIQLATEQGIDVLGQRAVSLGVIKLSDVAEDLGNITITIPEFAFSVNPDGSITVSDQPYNPAA